MVDSYYINFCYKSTNFFLIPQVFFLEKFNLCGKKKIKQTQDNTRSHPSEPLIS